MPVDIVVAMLIAWAIGKANRVGRAVNGLTDAALDAAALRVHSVVVEKLGGDPAVRQLMNEARTTNGAVSPQTRVAAELSISRAVADDRRFGADLEQATAPAAPAPTASGAGARTYSGNVGVTGDINAEGSVTIESVVNQVKRRPVLATLVVVGALALLAFFADRLLGTTTSSDQTAGGPAAIAGTWTASDGSGTKTFGSDGGQCDGFYYSNGVPLDIGGPMTCTISSKPDTDGRYTLVVTQSPNRARYSVEFTDAEHATVFDSSGVALYDLERF
ncbi:hypothetical protein [Nocardia sp. AG03]|uniref:hypothetical protein n=1 Tax=Nocardia sp. AG03 TaxID=3025312 RepID=UPI0024187516|nr:hypothetical protein [Nocardia sp. AG03]